jgi:hypothetical protein
MFMLHICAPSLTSRGHAQCARALSRMCAIQAAAAAEDGSRGYANAYASGYVRERDGDLRRQLADSRRQVGSVT